MIDEYALVPDIFDPIAYSNSDRIEMCLPHLKEVLYQEALVRDLADGQWSRYCLENAGRLHKLAKEILRKLASRNRLRRFPLQSSKDLTQAQDWCEEALRGHSSSPLTGIIAAYQTKQQFPDALVASIETLAGCPWWQARSCSVTLDRKTNDYRRALDRILSHANSLMFIDPNLDPSRSNYREFGELLSPLAKRRPPPLIEIHRSFCLGDGRARDFLEEPEWRIAFAPLSKQLDLWGLSAEVFFWKDFHPRYLITDILGVVVEAGFDITFPQNDFSTWARLGRDDRDRIQRHFDPAARPHDDLKHRFRIGRV